MDMDIADRLDCAKAAIAIRELEIAREGLGSVARWRDAGGFVSSENKRLYWSLCDRYERVFGVQLDR